MNSEPVLERLEATHYLKALTLLTTQADRTRVSARRKDMLNLDRRQYEAHKEAITKGFLRAARQLREFGITTPKGLTNLPHPIVMAAVYAHSGDQTNTALARGNFKRWYWTTVLNESYGTRITDTQIAADFVELIGGLTTQYDGETTTFSGRVFNSARLAHDRQKTLTMAIQNMIVQEKRTRDWITGRPMEVDEESKSEMHHIFPKKWCSQNGIEPDYMESVANLTLIDSATNKTIGSSSPSKYLPMLQEKAGINEQQMNQILESHLIPVEPLRQDDFNTFHQIRATNLKNMVVEIIGQDRVI